MQYLITYNNKHDSNVSGDLPERSKYTSKVRNALLTNGLIRCFLFCLQSYFHYLCSINNNLVGKICLN